MGLTLPHLGVLIHVEGGEGIGDRRHRTRILAAIAQRERDGGRLAAERLHALELEPDIASHSLGDPIDGEAAGQIRVQPEAGDHVLQPGPAQDLLADGLQARVQLTGDRRSDEDVGHLGPVDQDSGRGLIDIRQKRHDANRGRSHQR